MFATKLLQFVKNKCDNSAVFTSELALGKSCKSKFHKYRHNEGILCFSDRQNKETFQPHCTRIIKAAKHPHFTGDKHLLPVNPLHLGEG